MRLITIGGVLLIMTQGLTALAVEPPSISPPAKLYEQGRSNCLTGKVLTAIGAVILVGSLVTAARYSGQDTCDQPGSLCLIRPRDIALLGTIVSFPFWGSGVAFWIGGEHQMTKAVRAGYAPVALTPTVTPIAGGFVAGFQLIAF